MVGWLDLHQYSSVLSSSILWTQIPLACTCNIGENAGGDPPKSTKPVGIQSITRPAPRNKAGAHEDLRRYGHWQPWTHHPKVPNDPSQYDEAKVVGFAEEVVQASLASAQIIWIIVCVEENRDHLHCNRGHDVASCLGHTGKTCLSASPKNSLTPLFYLRYRGTILVANHHFFATPLMDHLQ